MRNKFLFVVFILFVFYILIPFYSLAFSDTKYVWSEINNPTIETVSSINKDKR